ncbi:MAG: cysteine desulfurase family protein [Candidatus Zixiibacteriota bacterium]
MKTVYLDHNATTPVDPLVVEAMLPYLSAKFGNASSVHSFGREAKVALENAREQIAAVINCDPTELYFTSGGTESDNIAILGTAFKNIKEKDHIIVGAAEHHAVLEPAEYLAHRHNLKLDFLPVDREGFSSPDQLRQIVKDRTSIVSVMHANNETGTIQDIRPMAEVAHEKGSLFHTDAVQSTGKIPVDVRQMDVDMASITAHKIYGPKGIGALYIRAGIKVLPLFYGGSHERKRRPGTENVAGAVGFAKALEIALARQQQDYKMMSDLADYFIDKVVATIPDIALNGTRQNRVPQTVNISFNGVEGESIVLALDLKGIACSSGSACTSGATEPSHVLRAMGIESVMAQGAIRFSIGRSTTRDEIDYVLGVLPDVIGKLREMSPVYSKQ